MSRLIESLENRVLLSVTSAQLQANAQALVTATSHSTAALNGVRSGEFGLIKAVAANIKKNGGLIGNVVGSALTAALSGKARQDTATSNRRSRFSTRLPKPLPGEAWPRRGDAQEFE